MSEFSPQIAELDGFIDTLDSLEGKLIVVLHKAQNIVGWLPTEVQNHIAHRLRVPASKVYGVVTFYSFFNTKPKGKNKISVCLGTACFVRGSGDIADEFSKRLGIGVGETSEDKLYSLDSIRCVGACGLAPVVTVNGKVYGRVTVKDVDNILKDVGGNA
ncbi:NADH dehydrogenase [Clostridia bacterium]|nr:NADH dehydrogenase [Clostridia bacterium]